MTLWSVLNRPPNLGDQKGYVEEARFDGFLEKFPEPNKLVLGNEVSFETTKNGKGFWVQVTLVLIALLPNMCIYIYIPGPSKGCQMVAKGCQFNIP